MQKATSLVGYRSLIRRRSSQGEFLMRKMVGLLVCAMIVASHGAGALAQESSAVATVNPVVEWNKTLLVILSTQGEPPATPHPTRSFARMHAAIYDPVNALDRSHEPYLVELSR